MKGMIIGPGPGGLHNCADWKAAQSHTPASIAGWISERERDLYFNLAKQMEPGQTFVEIGTYGGSTPALVGLAAPAGVHIVAIDPFTNDTHEKGQRSRGVPEDKIETLEQLCKRNLIRAGLPDVEIIARSSHDVGQTWDRPIDWLIIDGDHSEEGCTQDLNDFAPSVVVGGLLVIDDYSEWIDVGIAVRKWLPNEPAGRWKKVWEYEPPEGSTIAFRRLA